MKVLVTGANGQLAYHLKEALRNENYTYIGYSRELMDITDSLKVNQVILTEKPDVVIHCAGYTNVNKAEHNYEQSYLVNCVGTKNIAKASERLGAKLLYVSTDYIFDGEKGQPYIETDQPNPINVYGRTKWLGELEVKKYHSNYFIIRTSWLYGNRGDHFVKKIIALANTRNTLPVVCDQIGSPTYCSDLADKMIEIMESNKFGIYHVSNTGFCSWYEFSKKIFENIDHEIELIPVISTNLTQSNQAKRPAFSALSSIYLNRQGFGEMRPWDQAISDFLFQYKNNRLFNKEGE
ncbi:dTDP-4-dehydrorhamnose reductase [Bacillus timonensis]|nr:dTDP-4-dehydrorhamnose reductase [Bacillus timonensis]